MDNSFLTTSGWIIALLSLAVNVLQLLKNNELKKKTTTSSQTVAERGTANQQVSTGPGDNYMSGGNINVKK